MEVILSAFSNIGQKTDPSIQKTPLFSQSPIGPKKEIESEKNESNDIHKEKQKSIDSLVKTSFLEGFEHLLRKLGKPMSFSSMYTQICQAKNIPDTEKDRFISQIYTDFISSGKFMFVEEDLWDLKSHQRRIFVEENYPTVDDNQDEYSDEEDLDSDDLSEMIDEFAHPVDNGYLEDMDQEEAMDHGYIGQKWENDEDYKRPIVKVNGEKICLPWGWKLYDLSEETNDCHYLDYEDYDDNFWDDKYDWDDFKKDQKE